MANAANGTYAADLVVLGSQVLGGDISGGTVESCNLTTSGVSGCHDILTATGGSTSAIATVAVK